MHHLIRRVGPPTVFALVALAARVPALADAVTDWNNIVIETNRADTSLPGPVHSARVFAMVHAAIYDAVNSLSHSHYPYLASFETPPGTSPEAAVAQAAHDVLAALYPAQGAALDLTLLTYLGGIPNGPGKDAGIALGERAAAAILLSRAYDNSDEQVVHEDGTDPGEWRPDPPNFFTAYAPHWPRVKPFVLRSGAQFRPPAPPPLNSPDYTEAYNEVKAYGQLVSASRTDEQTQIGLFWAYDVGTFGPPTILYNQNLQSIAALKGNSLEENARLFALANLAMGDAGIVSWDAKYAYNFWRPVTAIQQGDTDGNDDTIGDPSWLPLGAPGRGIIPDFTPPFPAYTSGHATFGAATFKTLELYYGTDNLEFTLASEEIGGVTRTFSSFSQAAEENGQSRIYLGIHWSFDKVYGISTGNQVAEYVFHNALRPKTDADMDDNGKVDGNDLILFTEKWYSKNGSN
ncbi:MAG: hypothetical protein GHCLOJNM_01492 [bacterium]|nr:hypothetical protein [bacterium]